MAETRADSIRTDSTEGPSASCGVQQLWREQNAAFRARVLEPLRATRTTMPHDEQRTQTA